MYNDDGIEIRPAVTEDSYGFEDEKEILVGLSPVDTALREALERGDREEARRRVSHASDIHNGVILKSEGRYEAIPLPVLLKGLENHDPAAFVLWHGLESRFGEKEAAGKISLLYTGLATSEDKTACSEALDAAKRKQESLHVSPLLSKARSMVTHVPEPSPLDHLLNRPAQQETLAWFCGIPAPRTDQKPSSPARRISNPAIESLREAEEQARSLPPEEGKAYLTERVAFLSRFHQAVITREGDHYDFTPCAVFDERQREDAVRTALWEKLAFRGKKQDDPAASRWRDLVSQHGMEEAAVKFSLQEVLGQAHSPSLPHKPGNCITDTKADYLAIRSLWPPREF